MLLLCWRDTGHPQGGGSETYLQRIGAQLAESGSRSRCAPRATRARRAARWSTACGSAAAVAATPCTSGRGWRWLAAGGARAAAAGATRCGDRHPERHAVPGADGFGGAVAVLVHHCHREQWPVAGPLMGRFGWYVESTLSPRLHRRNQYVTVSLPSARDLTELGVNPGRIAVVRNGLDEAPAATLSRRGRRRRGSRCCRGWCRTSRSRTRWTPSPSCAADSGPAPGHRRRRMVGTAPGRHAALLGISDAVTFHGHVDDHTKHQVLQRVGCMCCRRARRAGALAVTEAAQHAVPTIGYRSSGG